MPIERKGGTPAESVMDEDEPMDNPQEESSESQTAELPLSIVGGQQVKEGDVIRLTVVAVNQEGGSITVTYAHDKGGDYGGSDGMAAEFDKPMKGPMMKGQI